MSTRSVIATDHGDSFRGRYCHSDGYPSWNGRVIFDEIRSHPDGPAAGVEALRSFLSVDGRGACGISNMSPGFLNDPDETDWSDLSGSGNHRVYRDRPGESNQMFWYDHDSPEGEEFIYVATPAGLFFGPGLRWNAAFLPWSATPDWEALTERLYAEA